MTTSRRTFLEASTLGVTGSLVGARRAHSLTASDPIPLERRPTLDAIVPRFGELASLNEELGIRAGYQNHSGVRFGAAVWDLSRVLDALGSPWIGVQYDIRHAVVEGAYSWVRGLEMVAPFIHTLVAKDLEWEKGEDGWRVRHVPFGEGMVPLSDYAKELRRLGVSAPFSMHFEYPHPETGRRTWAVEAYGRDLGVLRTALQRTAS